MQSASLVSIVHTRLELLSTDLAEEREHLISLLVMRHSALGWDNDALPDDCREIVALLRMEQEKVVALVKAGPASAQA